MPSGGNVREGVKTTQIRARSGFFETRVSKSFTRQPIAWASKVHEAAPMKENIRQWLEIVVNGPREIFLALAAPDIVMRMPFAPPSVSSELRGMAQAADALSPIWDLKERFEWHDVKILGTEEPDLFVVTARSDVLFKTGKRYANRYVMLIRLRAGAVVEHTEYFNPLPVIEAFS